MIRSDIIPLSIHLLYYLNIKTEWTETVVAADID